MALIQSMIQSDSRSSPAEAGHIAQTTAAIGAMLGFDVVVIDPRAEYNNRERFPTATELATEEFAEAFSRLPIDETGYVIIYTWAHALDEECLRLALGTAAMYVGMIGSKKKVKGIRERLLAKGIARERLDRVHAPIGIEINAETPEEIAVSILAEIIRVKRQKPVVA